MIDPEKRALSRWLAHLRFQGSVGAGRAAAVSLPFTSTRRVPAKVAVVLQPRTVIRPAYLVLYLFRPFPHYQRGSLSTRSIDVSIPKLISDDCEKTLLIGPYPVREGTSFNVNGDQMIFHTDRVSTEVGYGP